MVVVQKGLGRWGLDVLHGGWRCQGCTGRVKKDQKGEIAGSSGARMVAQTVGTKGRDTADDAGQLRSAHESLSSGLWSSCEVISMALEAKVPPGPRQLPCRVAYLDARARVQRATSPDVLVFLCDNDRVLWQCGLQDCPCSSTICLL